MTDIAAYLEEKGSIRLSRAQKEAINACDGSVLLLAVPGAGKTTVLASRLANLIVNRSADPARMLTLTYNRESVRDLGRRWEALFGGAIEQPKFSTIHSFCLGLLGDYARGRGTQMPRIMDEGESTALLASIYRELTGGYIPDDKLSDLSSAVGYAVNMQLDRKGIEALGEQIDNFPEIYDRYVCAKRGAGMMDFDDMLLFAYTALERNPGLRARWADRYDYIALDEAQDTSRIQHGIIRMIARDNLFMVGDEDQSIYGFRGAYPQGMTGFFESFANGRLLKLETNYRSRSEITDAALSVIGNNTDRFPKQMTADRGSGGSVSIREDVDMSDEYDYILRQISAARRGKSFAVLYRDGFTAIGLADTLRSHGVEFFCRGTGVGYMNDHITREVASVMRLADAPGDTGSFARCYYRLGCSIPRDTARAAMESGSSDLLGWILDEADYYGKNSGKLGWTRRVLARMSKKKPSDRLSAIMSDIEYLSALEKRGQGGYMTSVYVQKLCLLQRLADGAGDMDSFIGRLQEAEAACVSDFGAAITLSTVHSAKGQEFDSVIIADALDGIFPGYASIETAALGVKEDMEEELRLFYTAMTRAKDSLEIIAPSSGAGRRLRRSRFIPMLDKDGSPLSGLVGARVAHCSFGIGEITAVHRLRRCVSVRFPLYGEKTFSEESLKDKRIFRLL